MNKLVFIVVALLTVTWSLFGEWLEKTYLDDFGDPTDIKYIETSMTGSFSNIDVDNADAYVKFIYSGDFLLEFVVSEYKLGNKANFEKGVFYILYVKDDNGNIMEYSHLISTSKGKLFLLDEKLIEQIKKNNKLKMIIRTDGNRLKFNFTMNCIGFCKALKYLE